MSKPVIDIISSLHDSNLLSIDFENQIKLIFKTTDAKKICVTLLSTKHFFCNGLKEGNIVLEFSLTKGARLTKNLVEMLFDAKNSSNPKLQTYIDKIDTALLNGDLVLASLSPSYGCELVAICEDVIFDELEIN